MNAVPKWTRLLEQLANDVRHGAPIDYIDLTPEECLQWIAEEEDDQMFEVVLTSLRSADLDGQYKRLPSLFKAMLGDVTADQLIDLRDTLRSAIADYCTRKARAALEEA